MRQHIQEQGPIIVCIDATALNHYVDGVIDSSMSKPPYTPDHAVLIVGITKSTITGK